MGNRAVIAFDKFDQDNGQGVYLHWNGGRDSIESFLYFVRSDTPLIQEQGVDKLLLALNVFGVSAHEIKVEPLLHLDCDNYDNGVYVVDTNTWEITDRVFKCREEQDSYDRETFMRDIYIAILEQKVQKLEKLVNVQDRLTELEGV
jgi:hypothetical protein